MSQSISDAFVLKYADDFHMVAQQTKSRLQSYANQRGMITGESFTAEPLASVNYQEIITRHGDTPIGGAVNTRRFGDMRDAEVPADLIDRADELKLLINPRNKYTMGQISSLNRFKDKVIIDALLGSARTQIGGAAGSQALPAAQQIANGGTGLTVSKLIQAKTLLDEAEMDDSAFFQMTGLAADGAEPSYICVITAGGLQDLLTETDVKSADYNVVRALVNGTINTYMGCRFVKVQSLPKASTIRSAVMYAPRALDFGVGREPNAMLNQRADKRNAWQIYSDCSVGAVRVEDAGVVQIDFVD